MEGKLENQTARCQPNGTLFSANKSLELHVYLSMLSIHPPLLLRILAGIIAIEVNLNCF